MLFRLKKIFKKYLFEKVFLFFCWDSCFFWWVNRFYFWKIWQKSKRI